MLFHQLWVGCLCIVKALPNDFYAANQCVAQHVDFDGVIVFIAKPVLHLW